MIKLPHFSFSLVLLMSAGCSGFGQLKSTHYNESDEGGSASLIIENSSGSMTDPVFYADAAECKASSRIGRLSPGNQQAVRVPAGRDFAFTVALAQTGIQVFRECDPTISYIPVAGHAYLARFTTDYNECRIDFAEQTRSADGTLTLVPADFHKRKWRRAIFESGSFCEKRNE